MEALSNVEHSLSNGNGALLTQRRTIGGIILCSLPLHSHNSTSCCCCNESSAPSPEQVVTRRGGLPDGHAATNSSGHMLVIVLPTVFCQNLRRHKFFRRFVENCQRKWPVDHVADARWQHRRNDHATLRLSMPLSMPLQVLNHLHFSGFLFSSHARQHCKLEPGTGNVCTVHDEPYRNPRCAGTKSKRWDAKACCFFQIQFSILQQ